MRNLAAVITVFGLVLLVPILAPRVAQAADDTATAREHFEKGKTYTDLAKYNEAAAEYEAAYAAKPDPTLLYNIAQSYRLAGNPEKAVHFYRKYLQYVPKSPYRADVEDKIAALEKQLKSGEGGTSPPNTGGGTSVGTGNGAGTGTPPPYNNQPPPPPPPPNYGGAMPPGGNPGMDAPPPGGPPPGPGSPAAGPDRGKNLKIAGLATGGVGVVSIVLAFVYGAQARDAAQKIESAAALGDTYDSSLQAQDSRGRSAQTKGTVLGIVGVLALAGGGALYYVGVHQSKEVALLPSARSVALLPSASPTDVGAALRVTF